MAPKTTMDDHVIALTSAVARVEGKIDTFLSQMKAHDDRTTDLEVRTRKLENKQYWLSGVAAAIGTLLGVGGAHSLLR
jgi:hypothetical protein